MEGFFLKRGKRLSTKPFPYPSPWAGALCPVKVSLPYGEACPSLTIRQQTHSPQPDSQRRSALCRVLATHMKSWGHSIFCPRIKNDLFPQEENMGEKIWFNTSIFSVLERYRRAMDFLRLFITKKYHNPMVQAYAHTYADTHICTHTWFCIYTALLPSREWGCLTHETPIFHSICSFEGRMQRS